jgi:ferredoxin
MTGLQPDAGEYTVLVMPLNATFDVLAGETVMKAASRHNYYWPTVCGGRGECAACALVIEQGIDNAGPVTAAERLQLACVAPHSTERLACQLTISGSIRARKNGVRKRITE